MKIVVFGVGNYYREQREKLWSLSEVEIIAFADNNHDLWNQKVDGIQVIPPDLIASTACDIIVIMSIYAREIYEQLIALGVDQSRIVIWERFFIEWKQKNGELLRQEFIADCLESDVLIISYVLNYDGASLAAVYAATALKKRGMSVAIAAAGGGEKFIRETVQNGISIILEPSLPYIMENQKEWFRQFKVVIVNTFPMIECACEISKICPTVWWIHEASTFYASVTRKYPNSLDVKRLANINVYAVGKNAQKHFNNLYSDRIKNILPYGIPDMAMHGITEDKQSKRIVFAIIGTLYPLKGQDIFLNAVRQLHDNAQAEFWIIGRFLDSEKDYSQKIEDLAVNIDSVKIIGELTREEMYEAFPQIDIVVCASHEDTMPITITEAMMYGKVCIITDNTGTADYIQDGVNGFIVPTNDASAMAERMQWVIEHQDQLDQIGTAARKVYEEYFSMDRFGENLEKVLNKTKLEWEKPQ